MPFSHSSYRWLKQQNYTYIKAKNTYILSNLTYIAMFTLIGCIFIGLYVDKMKYLNQFTCQQLCTNYYGFNYNCGNQLCCENANATVYEYFVTYQQCQGTYDQTIYLILITIIFTYVFYEISSTICIVTRASFFLNYKNQPQQENYLTDNDSLENHDQIEYDTNDEVKIKTQRKGSRMSQVVQLQQFKK